MMKKWKYILIVILMLPIVAFFPACTSEDSTTTTTPIDTTYTVHFYTGTNESYNISNQVINHGGLVRKPQQPTRTGHVFVGWYKDRDFKFLWNFELDTVTENMTLYAKWLERNYG